MIDRARAESLDAEDPLAGFRERFVTGDDVLAYLDGNSLGRLPRATLARAGEVVGHEWGSRLIRGWEEGWLELPVTVGDELGAAALGAAPGQVVVGDSTTVCLYKLASAGLELRTGRTEIVTNRGNFPTDRFALEGLARARGCTLRWIEDGDGGAEDEHEGLGLLAELVSERTALVSLSHVDYRTGEVADMPAVNRVVHASGALVLWDLSHSVGALPVRLDEGGADLAVGCTYKYLCGGPGAPAFMYARRELQGELRQPIWGWLGREDPFAMADGWIAAPGVTRLLSGTPPIIALSCVREGVRLVAEAGIEPIRTKGIALTELAVAIADERLSGFGVTVGSPRDPARRGAHVALRHPDAERLCRELVVRGVIPDFRHPDVIRVGLSPLSTRFAEVWDGLDVLRELLSTEQ